MGSDSPEDRKWVTLDEMIARLTDEQRAMVTKRKEELIRRRVHRWRVLYWQEWLNMTGET